MDIITSHAQIKVKDSETSCGANINRCVNGYVADLQFWGDSIWIARRKGESGLHLMIAPSDRWRGDIEDEAFEIIGRLSDLAKTAIEPSREG